WYNAQKWALTWEKSPSSGLTVARVVSSLLSVSPVVLCNRGATRGAPDGIRPACRPPQAVVGPLSGTRRAPVLAIFQAEGGRREVAHHGGEQDAAGRLGGPGGGVDRVRRMGRRVAFGAARHRTEDPRRLRVAAPVARAPHFRGSGVAADHDALGPGMDRPDGG